MACSMRASGGRQAGLARKPRGVACRVASLVPQVTTQSDNGARIAPANLEEALALAEHFNRAFSTSQYKEHSYSIKKIEGNLPEGLRGTLLRNGPGLFEVGGKRVSQPFDGDGMVCAIALDGQGGAHFTNRFVRTSGFLAERRAGKQLYRSAFNRALPDGQGLELQLPFGLGTFKFSNPLDLKIKDVANTNVLRWGGKTLALYERGMPHALTPTLDTAGVDSLQDSLVDPFVAAHLRLLQEPDGSSRAVMFSATEEGLDAVVTCYEYAPDFTLLSRSRHVFPGGAFGMYHDMAVSEHFYVFLENPLRMDLVKLLTQTPIERASIAECLQFQEDVPTKLHLIPRPGKGVKGGMRTYEVPGAASFTFHHGNAYEVNANGTPASPGTPGRYLVLDSCSNEMVDFSLTSDSASSKYYGSTRSRAMQHRLVVDLSAPVAPQAITRTSMLLRSVEFPSVAPSKVGKPHTHTYLAASAVQGGSFFGPNQVLIKLSTDPLNGVGKPFNRNSVTQTVWAPPSPLHFPGEPVFIPRHVAGGNPNGNGNGNGSVRAAEDDGWIASVVFDAGEVASYVVLLDASTMTEVAKLHLSHHVPAGLHGMFTPEYLGPAPGTPDAVPYDIRSGV